MGLSQCVHGPTRSANLLDIVLTNTPDLLHDLIVAPPFSTSDHDSLSFTLYMGTFKSVDASPPPLPPRFDFAHANMDALIAELTRTDWNTVTSHGYRSNTLGHFC